MPFFSRRPFGPGAVTLLLVFFFVPATVYALMNPDKTLDVVFPFKHLKKTDVLLDPSNTETIYEYYLLENLGVGLVRDDVADIRGYKGALASHWEQVNPTHWAFTLRKDLKWSDGSPVTGEEIVAHFQGLKARGSRHLLNLVNLKSVSLEAKTNSLHFHFQQDTNESFLHELSLADAVLLHPGNLTKNWQKTSGAYFVSYYDHAEGRLELTANPHNPLIGEKSPRKVKLFPLKQDSDVTNLFSTIKTDIYSMPLLPFTAEYKTLTGQAPAHKLGQPNFIFYWQFKATHPLTQNADARKELADLIAATFRGFSASPEATYYSQLVPLGYRGALESFEVPPARTSALKGKTILLRFRPPYRGLPQIEELKKNAAARGVNLKLAFDGNTSAELADADEYARVQGFKGNQKDSIGSWGFLYAKNEGNLSPFRDRAEGLLKKAIQQKSAESKDSALLELHKFTLDNAFAIPFLVYTERILTSDRINLDRWNRFDLRLRFYDVEWK